MVKECQNKECEFYDDTFEINCKGAWVNPEKNCKNFKTLGVETVELDEYQERERLMKKFQVGSVQGQYSVDVGYTKGFFACLKHIERLEKKGIITLE